MLGKKSTIGIFDCLEGQFRMLEKFPFIVGCMGNAGLAGSRGEDWEGACMVKKSGNAFRIVPNKKGDERLLVNGGPFAEPFNEDDEVCTLQFLGYPLIVFAGKDPKAWADQIQKGQWILTNGRTGTDYAQCSRYEVLDKIREMGADLSECAIKPVGLDVPFWVVHLVEFLQPPEDEEEEEEGLIEEQVVVDPDRGEFTCPTCWLKFDRADVLSIAVHEDLRGDRKLGEDAMLRFVPTEFNSKGQAMDAMGLPTTDVACAHCHRKLPPGFMDAPTIFSPSWGSKRGQVLLSFGLGQAASAYSFQGIRGGFQGCRPDLQRHHQLDEESSFCRKQRHRRHAHQDAAGRRDVREAPEARPGGGSSSSLRL